MRSKEPMEQLDEMASEREPRKSISCQLFPWNKITRKADISFFVFPFFYHRLADGTAKALLKNGTRKGRGETYANSQFRSYVMFSSSFRRGLVHSLSIAGRSSFLKCKSVGGILRIFMH